MAPEGDGEAVAGARVQVRVVAVPVPVLQEHKVVLTHHLGCPMLGR